MVRRMPHQTELLENGIITSVALKAARARRARLPRCLWRHCHSSRLPRPEKGLTTLEGVGLSGVFGIDGLDASARSSRPLDFDGVDDLNGVLGLDGNVLSSEPLLIGEAAGAPARGGNCGATRAALWTALTPSSSKDGDSGTPPGSSRRSGVLICRVPHLAVSAVDRRSNPSAESAQTADGVAPPCPGPMVFDASALGPSSPPSGSAPTCGVATSCQAPPRLVAPAADQ